MGTTPPTDFSPPDTKTDVPSTTGMADGLPSDQLCGFKLPSISIPNLFNNFKLPDLGLPAFPNIVPPISISCDSANPLKTNSEWGAGRPSNIPDPNDQT